MRRIGRAVLVLATALAGASSCGITTEPVQLQDFQWIAIDKPQDVIEGMDAAAFQGDVAVLGQMKTPTLCFRLSGSLDVNGSTATIHINAEQSSSPNCGNSPGGYQYTAAIRGLNDGDYTVRVIHSVPGIADKEFTKTITVR
jgi:hypothetical protein